MAVSSGAGYGRINRQRGVGENQRGSESPEFNWFIACPLYLKTQADKPASLPWPAVDTSQRPRDSSTEGQSRFSCVHLDSEQLSRFN